MIIHMDVSARAIKAFKSADPSYPYEEVLEKYNSYVQAGSPFPDWGYLCGTPAGEDSHWPPFIASYKAYLEKTYPRGSDRYNQLLAFMFGVESHIEADVIWHWGRNTATTESQGYLQSMSHDGSDCKDSWNTPGAEGQPSCHTLGDNGADFYDTGRGGMAWQNETWTIPVTELSEIYKTMNLTEESPQKLVECTLTMYLGSILERHFSSLITFHFDTYASFLTEELDLWYHGGIEDMGINVAWKWQQLSDMFKKDGAETKGVKGLGAGKCSVFGSGFLRNKVQEYAQLMGAQLIHKDSGDVEYTYDKETLKMNTILLTDKLFNDLGLKPWNELHPQSDDIQEVKP
jgi:glycosylphosphatidylinositol phospholipase D